MTSGVAQPSAVSLQLLCSREKGGDCGPALPVPADQPHAGGPAVLDLNGVRLGVFPEFKAFPAA